MHSALRFLSVFLAIILTTALAIEPAEAARKKARKVVYAPKYSAIVVEAGTGAVLFEKYATEQRFPASLTKMMTLYLLFDELEAGRLSLDSRLAVSSRAASQPPSKLGLAPGSTIDVDSAIKALVVNSANDVAVVVAEAVSGTEAKFALKMTEKAQSLGMKRTLFKNASGLPNPTQKTTARDLATLSRRLMRDFPQYYPYFSTVRFTWNERTYLTHNSLVRTYPGAEGLKTGYTRVSGFNLATSAERDGRKLVGVVMGGRSVRSRDQHMKDILDSAFEALRHSPALVASASPQMIAPRLKPTLVAELERQKEVRLAAAKAQAGAALIASTPATPGVAAPNAPETGDVIRSLILAAGEPTAEPEASDLPVAGDTTDEAETAIVAAIESEWAEGDSDGDYGGSATWSVQIGAYSTRALAETELKAATDAAKLQTRAQSIESYKDAAGKDLFRARFIALTAGEASDVCETLKTSGRSCFVANEAVAP
jgi:D-alanyl-D-alanine carboxypeptidase